MFTDDPGGGGGNPSLDDPPADPPSDDPPPDPPHDPTKSIWGETKVEWPEGFQEELKEENSLVPFVDKESGKINFSNLMKSYIHTKKSVGGDKLTPPTEHSSEEDKNEFFKKAIGWEPDKDKYEIKAGEESQLGEEFAGKLKEKAHSLKIPASAAQELLNFVDAESKQSLEGMTTKSVEQKNEGWEKLKKEWGNGYEGKVAAAKLLVNEKASEEFKTYLKDNGLSDDPMVFSFLANLAEEVYADAELDTGDRTSPNGMTPEEASKKINEIMNDKNHPYHSKKTPGHADAVKDMQKLFRAKRGQKSA